MFKIVRLYILVAALICSTIQANTIGYTHRLSIFATGVIGCYHGATMIRPVLEKYPKLSPYFTFASAAIIACNYPLCITETFTKNIIQEYALSFCMGLCASSAYSMIVDSKDDVKDLVEDLFDYARS